MKAQFNATPFKPGIHLHVPNALHGTNTMHEVRLEPHHPQGLTQLRAIVASVDLPKTPSLHVTGELHAAQCQTAQPI